MNAQPDLLAQAEPEPKLHINTPAAREMLRKKYAAPEWALMEEVAPATGGGTRYADAVAVNLWSSRGHAIHGFEIKISRADWLRELKDPSKADVVAKYCDFWWIVAPKGIVRPEELPPTWGLYECRASGLFAAKPAPKLESTPPSRAFFASMMRRGFELLDRHAARLVDQERMNLRNQQREEVARQVREATSEMQAVKKQIAEIEEATGLHISRHSLPPKNIIALAKKLQSLGGYYSSGDGFGALLTLAGNLERAAGQVREAVTSIGMEPSKKDEAA